MNISFLDILYQVTLTGWLVVATSFLLTLFSSVILWQDSTKKSSQFFFIFGILAGVWGIAYAFFEGTVGTSLVHQSIVLLYLVSGMVPLVAFLYLYVFSIEKTSFSFWKLVGMISPYLAISSTLIIPDFIVGYQVPAGKEVGKVVFGSGYFLYIFYVASFLIAGLVVLLKKYRESAGIFKIVIRDLLVTLSIGFIIILFVELLFPLISNGENFFWLGHISVIIFGFAISLIIVRYNFWSIKVVATEFLVSLVVIVLIVELFLANTEVELLVKTMITVLVVFSSSFLSGSVEREAQSKQKIARLLRDLEFLSKQFKVLDKKKTEFLSISSHHLRDPLTAINGYASMLLEGSFGEISAPLRESLEKIFESSKRLITMISDFLDISRIESGSMNYDFSDIDLGKVVREITEEMKFNADRAHLALSMTIKENAYGSDTYITVGDEGKLRQVISNLVDNAIKYTPQGEIIVGLERSENRKKLTLSVSDTGIGMNKETQEKIFKKFSRADGVSKLYTEGTGLGLYVAKEIIKKHEGRIWAESKGEKLGSQFFIELEAKL